MLDIHARRVVAALTVLADEVLDAVPADRRPRITRLVELMREDAAALADELSPRPVRAAVGAGSSCASASVAGRPVTPAVGGNVVAFPGRRRG
ncbi:hypothetical protein [Blastochloris tepida]|uniref:hypothetical protein n=1 Tax=Blastochloris tepida TaxID=2233851 RepID=UPI000F82DAEA|nr:hypothetical protein [Blastochloris tepida]